MPSLRFRNIEAEDLEQVKTLLTLGFRRQRTREFWNSAIRRLTERACPEGYPRYGYLLDCGGEVVGVILQIFTHGCGNARVRCNFSSWWVKPEFRMYGPLLLTRAHRHDATYTTITPAPQIRPILEAQGYAAYCRGRAITLPWLAKRTEPAIIHRFSETLVPVLPLAEAALLRDHERYGCMSLLCQAGHEWHPFVFALRRRAGIVRLAVLTYCHAKAEFPRFAAPLGRYLARRGYPVVVLDANALPAGIPGIFRANKPKYFLGPDLPYLHDHAYSERAMFGA